MGKKLRNREILDQTDKESVDGLFLNHFPKASISNQKIREYSRKIINKQQKQFSTKSAKFFRRLRSVQFKEVIDESKLECPICLELMVSPTIMVCGHLYCLKCLQSNQAHSQNCCLCRQQQQNYPFMKSRLAETLISSFLIPDQNQLLRYLCRITDSDEWIKKRTAQNFKIGLMLDFKDYLNIWRKGIIVQIDTYEGNKTLLTIKMMLRGQETSEVIDVNSRRLAPLSFFTRGKYLESFTPIFPENDLQERELHHLEYNNYFLQDQFFRDEVIEAQPQPINFEGEYALEDQNAVQEAILLFNSEIGGNQQILI